MKIKRIGLLIIFTGMIVGFGASNSWGQDNQEKETAEYTIMAGDKLKVVIFPEDTYVKGGTMQVSSEGSITLPLAGKIKVAGKTPKEAGRELAKIIDEDYLVNAQAVIEVVESAVKSEEDKKNQREA